jgi:DNA-binding transcriptional MerR regulator
LATIQLGAYSRSRKKLNKKRLIVYNKDMTDAKDKESYTIQQVSELTELSKDTLRFYEKEGILFPIARKVNGHREFNRQDLEWIRFIACLKSTGMPLSSIREYRDLLEQGEGTTESRKNIMVRHRQHVLMQIDTLRENLERINYKIRFYDKLLADWKEIKKG